MKQFFDEDSELELESDCTISKLLYMRYRNECNIFWGLFTDSSDVDFKEEILDELMREIYDQT